MTTTPFNSLITNTSSKVSNPDTSPIKVIDEFQLSTPEQQYERAQAAVGVDRKYITAEDSKKFFTNYFTRPSPVLQGDYDQALAFFTSRGFDKTAAQPLVSQMLQIAYYGKQPVYYYLEQLDKLPDRNAINIKILQILNDAGKGSYYLALKIPRRSNTYVERTIVS